MSRSARCKTSVCFLLFLVTGLSGRAAEIRLQGRIYCETGLVRLGDVAEVSDVDYTVREVLEELALVPAPTASHSRQLSASEIRRILERRGVDAALLRFTGARHVIVMAGPAPARSLSATAETSARSKPPSNAAAASATQPHPTPSATYEIRQAIVNSLPAMTDQTGLWDVDVTMARQDQWQMPEVWTSIEVPPLQMPYEGRHRVVAHFTADQRVIEIPVTVQIGRRRNAVVVARHLKAGDVIGDADVCLEAIDDSRESADVVRYLEDVIGSEVTRDLEPGQAVTERTVRAPLLVHRRDVVRVIARRGSIVASLSAIALSDGGLNDVIQVERLDDKNVRLQARVTADGQVEVVAGVARVRSVRKP